MRCDIDNETILTLHIDVPTFSVLQTALSFYVERASLPAGHPAREMMWKFSTMLSNLQKCKTGDRPEPIPSGVPSAAPALSPPAPVGNPTPPLAEMVVLASVEAPEEDWDSGCDDCPHGTASTCNAECTTGEKNGS